MKPYRVIDLSFSRKLELVGHHRINQELLWECAYYPVPACQECSFNNPNLKCSHSHLLINTRINPPDDLPIVSAKNKTKTRVKRKFSLEELLSNLSAEEREDIEKFIAERRTKG